MSTAAAVPRDVALKLANWLAGKERRAEAVELLCVGAVSGANDEEGQKLLGEALRLTPDSPIAKAAFARMEGLAGEHPELDAVIVKYTAEAIEKLEKERTRPQFMRAQVGFNNNLKYKDKSYHVQTEDSGLKMPHVITHLFADGGRVIKSHKRSYEADVDRSDIGPHVRALMKAQHMEMVLFLREGRFDEVIAGRAMGGLTQFTEPPQVDMQQVGSKKKKGSEPKMPRVEAPIVAAPVAEAAPARPHFALRVIRSLVQGPEVYEPNSDDVIIGPDGDIPLLGEKFCHPKEAMLRYGSGELWIEDLDGGNGVFIRIKRPVELDFGAELIVGDQLLRIERNPERDNHPGPGPTYMWFSPHPDSSFRIVQILQGGVPGAIKLAGGTTMVIGREQGDLTFPKDPFVAERHCLAEDQAGVIVVTDMGSRWGTFVRIQGEQQLLHHDELLIGRTRLRVELRQ